MKRKSLRKLDYKIGFACNNYCIHCVQGGKRESVRARTLFQIMRDIRESAATCTEVVFTGGEPTIHPHFLEAVREAARAGYSVIQVQSNGRMFVYPEFCRAAMDAGVNDFCVAVLGDSARLHEAHTLAKGSFSQVVQGIRNLRSLGCRVSVNSVITKLNYRRLPRLAMFLSGLGVAQVQFAFPHPGGRAWINFPRVVPRMSTVVPFVCEGLRKGAQRGVRMMTEAIPPCMLPGFEGFIAERIMPDATVFDGDLVIERYEEYRRDKGKRKGPRCGQCRYFPSCEGTWKEYPEKFGWKEFRPVV
jgi:MoaA/NifB/PqqE/SkfB family radical SAM enzyme